MREHEVLLSRLGQLARIELRFWNCSDFHHPVWLAQARHDRMAIWNGMDLQIPSLDEATGYGDNETEAIKDLWRRCTAEGAVLVVFGGCLTDHVNLASGTPDRFYHWDGENWHEFQDSTVVLARYGDLWIQEEDRAITFELLGVDALRSSNFLLARERIGRPVLHELFVKAREASK